jgi:hypothetical protein
MAAVEANIAAAEHPVSSTRLCSAYPSRLFRLVIWPLLNSAEKRKPAQNHAIFLC